MIDPNRPATKIKDRPINVLVSSLYSGSAWSTQKNTAKALIEARDNDGNFVFNVTFAFFEYVDRGNSLV